jgi:hypothetical protein
MTMLMKSNIWINDTSIIFHSCLFCSQVNRRLIDTIHFIKDFLNVKDSVELTISGMTCAACSNRIEKVLNKMDGVDQATVNFFDFSVIT